MYAIDDEASFTEAKALVEKAKQHLEADSCENQAVVMVANKMDLESTRKVSKDDANAFAAGEKLTLIECSAKARDRGGGRAGGGAAGPLSNLPPFCSSPPTDG